MKEVFYTPQDPQHPSKGVGWVEIEQALAHQLGIRHLYKYRWRGGNTNFTGPGGQEFWAYADNPNAYGGRHKRRFIVHTHGQTVLLLAQKKLTIDAVLWFIRRWAEPTAKVITPGKRTIDLSKQSADTPAYVYFILNRDSQAIKIGFAQDVHKRLETLQTSSPSRLELMGTIQAKSNQAAKTLEKRWHQEFASLRLQGEWFKAEEPLVGYIQSLSKSTPK